MWRSRHLQVLRHARQSTRVRDARTTVPRWTLHCGRAVNVERRRALARRTRRPPVAGARARSALYRQLTGRRSRRGPLSVRACVRAANRRYPQPCTAAPKPSDSEHRNPTPSKLVAAYFLVGHEPARACTRCLLTAPRLAPPADRVLRSRLRRTCRTRRTRRRSARKLVKRAQTASRLVPGIARARTRSKRHRRSEGRTKESTPMVCASPRWHGMGRSTRAVKVKVSQWHPDVVQNRPQNFEKAMSEIAAPHISVSTSR